MSPKLRRGALVRAAKLVDLAVVNLAFIVAFAITSSALNWPTLSELLILRIKLVNVLLFATYLLFCSAVFSISGFYLSHRLSYWVRQAREVVLAVSLVTMPIVLLRWPFGLEFATTQFLGWYWSLTILALLLVRITGRKILYFLRSQGKNLRTVVIVGQSSKVDALANRIEKDTSLGYRIVRVIDVKEDHP